MPKDSLEVLIAKNIGRMAFNLFTEDKEFKSASNCEDICQLLNKRSNGEINTTPPTIIKMVTSWIAANKCKVSDFADILKSNKTPSKKGKTSYRESIEKHFGKNIWEVFKEELVSCKNIRSAIAKLRNSSDITTSEDNFKRTIQSGLENKEFSENVFWAKWIPKKRKKRTRDEIDQEERLRYHCKELPAKVRCKKCSWKGGISIPLIGENLVVPVLLGARRCPGCAQWGTFVASIEINNKTYHITNTKNKEGTVSEDFVDDNMNIIPNPFLNKNNMNDYDKYRNKTIKQRVAEW